MSSAEQEHLDGKLSPAEFALLVTKEVSPAEFAQRVTRERFAAEIEELLECEPYPSRARIEVVAGSLGISATAIAAELKRRQPNGNKLEWKPFTEEELNASSLTPPFLAESYLYRDVAVLAAPGGSSKTTICLWEAIHLALGLPLYGLRTSQAGTLYVTGEDSREVLGATLRELMAAMDLSEKDREVCLQRIVVLDLVGRPFRLCELGRNGNIETTKDVDMFIEAFRDMAPGLVIFDPLVSFGAAQESVNTAAQGAINAARRIMRELGCCTRLVHHCGQAIARENIRDQYAPRGGSALSDGARSVTVISRLAENERPPFPVGHDDHVIVLSRPKIRYAKPNQPDIFLKRAAFSFEYQVDIQHTKEEIADSIANQVHQFLTDQLTQGNKYTARSLEEILPELKLTRKELRDALAKLRLQARIFDAELPKGEQRGQRKEYLNPVQGNAPNQDGALRRDS